LDEHLGLRMLAQVLGVGLDEGPVLFLDVELVEVVVDRALRKRARRVLQLVDVARGGLRGEVDGRDARPRACGPRRPGRAFLDARRLLFLVGRRGAAGADGEGARDGDGCDEDCAHVCSFHSMKGPQAGSRTSPPLVVRRCRMRPSEETADSTPRSPMTVAKRIMRPLGAKLGDSSRSLSVTICTWLLARSSSATWNLPSLRVM